MRAAYLFACFWFVLFTVAGWMIVSLADGGDRFSFTVSVLHVRGVLAGLPDRDAQPAHHQ